MKIVRSAFAGLLLLAAHSFCFAQKGNVLSIADAFDAYIQRALPVWKTPGISVVVVKDGKVVFKKGYGVEELGKSAPFTPATLGVCASTTKAMTAVCMGMLVDEGKIGWDDKLKDVWPEFALSDPAVTAELRVRDLFTHNAGLGNTDNLWTFGFSREEILRRMRNIPLSYSLRSSFVYQNCMYIAAGELIHKLTDSSWEDFITRRLFGPVGMQHSYASHKLSVAEPSHESTHFMVNDTVRNIPYLEYDNVGPAGGVWSCADDLGKWMQFLLDSAKTAGGVRLLKAETFEELFKPAAFVTPEEFYPTARLTHPHWTTYGLGWFQEDYNGQMVQFHTGSLDGAVAILGLIPEKKFGVYILGNLDHSEIRHALMYTAMDYWNFPAFKSNDWSSEMYAMYSKMRADRKKREQDEDAKRVTGTKPSLPLSGYAGKYKNVVYGDATVTVAGDSLLVTLPNDVSLHLGHWNYDTFKGPYNYFWWGKDLVQFIPDTEGKVARFEISGVAYELQAEKKGN